MDIVEKKNKVSVKPIKTKKQQQTLERITKLIDTDAVVDILDKSHALCEALPQLRQRLLAPFSELQTGVSVNNKPLSQRSLSSNWRLSVSEYDASTRNALNMNDSDDDNHSSTIVTDVSYPFNKVCKEKPDKKNKLISNFLIQG